MVQERLDMIKLLKNCDVYAPEHIGIRDILIVGDKIGAIVENLDAWKAVPDIEVYDLCGRITCPGIIDLHVHITGGGGEDGPASRTPELKLTDFTRNGVTTVLGLLGTDGISRSVENLLFKARALEEEGITTYILTGNYKYPTFTVTGSVDKDIAIIDKCVGVKLAVADHRSSHVDGDEIKRLASEARVAGLISGKAGLTVMHMGNDRHHFEEIFNALDDSALPPANLLPTHCGRTPELIADAVKFNKMGGTIDFTAGELKGKGTARKVVSAIAQGADPARITMSSDAGGSQPAFDAEGNCIGLTYDTSVILLGELRRFVFEEKMPLAQALTFFTSNPAAVLKLKGKKGCLAEGADADILVFDENLEVNDLWAKGKCAIRQKETVMKGYFE